MNFYLAIAGTVVLASYVILIGTPTLRNTIMFTTDCTNAPIKKSYPFVKTFKKNDRNSFLFKSSSKSGLEFFESLCNFLYFLSISFSFFYYYNSDDVFRFYFRKRFFKETSPSEADESKIKEADTTK